MAGWRKANLDDVQAWAAPGADVEGRLARGSLGGGALGVSRFRYGPGARMPFGHRHREQEEAFVVVSGSGRAKLDDDLVDLAPGDVLRVPPAVIRAFEGGPDGMELLCVGGPRGPRGDTERFPDFWP